MNQLYITVANLTTNIKKPLPAYALIYLQGLIDELCNPEATITADQFYSQFRCVLKACGCHDGSGVVATPAFSLPAEPKPVKPEPAKTVQSPFSTSTDKTLDDAAKYFSIGRTKFIQWLPWRDF